MTDIMMYLIIGVVIGSAAIYLLFYRAVRREVTQAHAELDDSLVKRNELQALLQEERSTLYQIRQAQQQQQDQFKSDLAQEHERYTALEQQRTDLQTRHDQQQQDHQSEATKLRRTIENLEQERAALQDRFARDSEQWGRERQSQALQNNHLEEQLEMVRRDKRVLDEQLEQQQESWERERLALQIQLNSLEDNLSLQTTRADRATQNLPLDSQHLMERFKAEAAEEWDRKQAAWEEERQALRERLERLQAEHQSLREQMMAKSAKASTSLNDEQVHELRQELEQAQQECQHLEEKLVARNHQAEQERSALEAEIEQLMDRLLRLHREQNL